MKIKLYDYVELIGETADGYEIPPGTRGYVIETYPKSGNCEVEFRDPSGNVLASSTVKEQYLVVIRRKEERQRVTA